MAIVWVCVCARMSVHVGAYFGGAWVDISHQRHFSY